MKMKGFTLVELIAIIIILSAIFLFSLPSLTNMINVDKEKKYDNMVNDLCSAGKTYMYSNMEHFEQLSEPSAVIEINIGKLIAYGNVDKNLVNPKTKLTVEKDMLKYTVLEDLSLDCQYIEG